MSLINHDFCEQPTEREDSPLLYETSTTLLQNEPISRVNTITSMSSGPYVQHHTTGTVIGVPRIAGKNKKSSRGKEVINLLEEGVNGDVNLCMSAQFNIPDFLGLVCHASLAG